MAPRAGWFSPDPGAAWVERVLLAQTPIWIVAVAVVMLGGWVPRLGEAGLLVFSIAVASPAVVLPWWLHARDPERFGGRHWITINLWSALLVIFGTYFGTHYFFDLMGMEYAFAVRWHFSAEVVGRQPGSVPVFMYPLTHAYFVSYYVALVVAWRGLRARLGAGTVGAVLVLAALSYAVAFGETFFMAADVLDDVFRYRSRQRMLVWGSTGYAAYFLIGVPMLDRVGRAEMRCGWSLTRVLVDAAATCMLILCALEVWAKIVGPL